MTDDAIEAVARAICWHTDEGRVCECAGPADCKYWDDATREARAAIAAYQPAVEEMIRQEREACAKLIMDLDGPTRFHVSRAAVVAAIHARQTLDEPSPAARDRS